LLALQLPVGLPLQVLHAAAAAQHCLSVLQPPAWLLLQMLLPQHQAAGCLWASSCCCLLAHRLLLLQLWCCSRPGQAAQLHHCKLTALLLVVLLAPAGLRAAPPCLLRATVLAWLLLPTAERPLMLLVGIACRFDHQLRLDRMHRMLLLMMLQHTGQEWATTETG
jgi:hypothetical protein